MAYAEAELNALLEIQQIDLTIGRAVKRRDDLPQRKKIIEARVKKKEIELKQEKVLVLHKDLDEQLVKLSTEDELLAGKQQEVQTKIDEVQGDYRSVEAFTKELNGFAKRRLTLEAELTALDEKLTQIKTVQNQIEDALANLEKNEQAAIESFQKEGGGINKEITSLESTKESLSGTVSPELLAEYEKGIKHNKGIAIAELVEDKCSVCRNILPEGKVLQARSEAPLSRCPLCKRMLVIKQ